VSKLKTESNPEREEKTHRARKKKKEKHSKPKNRTLSSFDEGRRGKSDVKQGRPELREIGDEQVKAMRWRKPGKGPAKALTLILLEMA